MRRLLSTVVLGAAVLFAANGAWAADTLGAFKLKTSDGKEITQENLKEKKTVVLVMQTACSQCRAEAQDMSEKYDAFKTKAEVYVALVDVSPERGLALYKELGYKMPVIVDDGFKLPSLAGLDVTPATFVVDKDLKILFKKTGYRAGDLDKLMEKL